MSDSKISKGPLDPRYKASVPTYNSLSDEKKKELKKLEGACKDFESIFVFQMMKEMKKTVHKNALNHGGFAEDVFSDMLDQERSKGMNIGLGDMLFVQLSKAVVPPTRKR